MVKWTRHARSDLKAIHDYIAKDAPINAKTVVRDIARKAETLAEFPHFGKKIPELNEEHLREIPVHSWRILYHLRNREVFIVTVIHKRRLLQPEQVTTRLPTPG